MKTSCPRKFKAQLKNRQLKLNYGISLLEYNNMLKHQLNKCVICGTKNPKGRGTFHVDHDHKTSEVRGLLCASCNLGLGNFKDSSELCFKAGNIYVHSYIKTRELPGL